MFIGDGLEHARRILHDEAHLKSPAYVRANGAPRGHEVDQVYAERMRTELATFGPRGRWLAHQRAGASTSRTYYPGSNPVVWPV
jgi:hypothetical protein